MPRRRATSCTLSVASGREAVGHSAIASRSRTCRTLTVVQVSAPSGGQRTRFRVIAICRSAHSGASRRMTSTGLGGEGARGRWALTRGTRTSLWRPPAQWISRTASWAASSRSITTSWIRIWVSRCRVRASAVGAFQAAGRSRASRIRASRSTFGRDEASTSRSAMRRSICTTRSSAAFQRASSSRATWRLAGSTSS